MVDIDVYTQSERGKNIEKREMQVNIALTII